MTEKMIHDEHWCGGSTKRWIYDDKYLVSATYSTGSCIYVEDLNFPGPRVNGWFYMIETEQECVDRLISKLENGWKHASWRESNGNFYGKIKHIDQLTEEKIKEIESNPKFECWEEINTYKFGEYITKDVYNPNKFAYKKLPHSTV